MTVLNKTPLSLAEVKSMVKDFEDKKPLEDYIKKFANISKDKSESLAKELHALNNPKVRDADVVKVSDFLPRTSEELNKLFVEVTLSEEESNAILEIVKKY